MCTVIIRLRIVIMATFCEYGTEPTDCHAELMDCWFHKAPLHG